MAFTPGGNWGQGRLLTGLSPGSSLSGFTAEITKDNLPTSALDTGSLSCLNGGGDWRYSIDIDGATQLPVKIVTCVTNATASNTKFKAVIRFPTYASGTREVYAFWNKAGESQPAANAAFGSEAVWQDNLIAANLDESSGSVANDSAGNRDGAYNGSLPTVGTDFGQDFNGSTDNVNFGNAAMGIASAFTFSLKIKPNSISGNQSLFTADDTDVNVRNWQWRIDSNGKVRIIPFDSGGSVIVNSAGTAVLSANNEYIVDFVWTGAAYKSYINGSEDLSVASTTNIADFSGSGFGGAVGIRKTGGGGGTTDEFNGQAGDLRVIAGDYLTADYIASKYSNQSNPAAFWTGGTVFVPGGTPLAITPNSINSASVSLNPTIQYSAIVNLTPNVINSSSVSLDPTIQYKSTLFLTPVTINSASISLNPSILLGPTQTIGNITAGFADDLYSVKYKISGITVNFKG
jgi:hypothetical protein